MDSSVLDISNKQNHTTCGLLCLVFVASDNVFRFKHGVVYITMSFLLDE